MIWRRPGLLWLPSIKFDHGSKSWLSCLFDCCSVACGSMLPGLVRALPLPDECVVLLLQGTRVCKSCFLESSNVHVQSSQLIDNDCCLPGVLDVLQTCGEAGHHCLDIPTPQFENWSFLIISLVVAWCHGSSLLFGFPLSPCTQWGWQTVAGQHLTGRGLPSLRRAIAVQWDPRISPTIRSNPWHRALCQSSNGL